MKRQFLWAIGLGLGLTTASGNAWGQSITSTGDNVGTVVDITENQYDISGGTQSGTNLFHSFERLGLSEGEIANFLSSPDIENILGRVTGGDASFIDGLLQVTGGDSNLFLMNPAGVIFGENAQLNVPADFSATTANAIGIDQDWFRSLGTNDYDALTGIPKSFAFSSESLGVIVNAGDLSVDAGQQIQLVGGLVVNTGTLTTPGGEITVEAIPGKGLVTVAQEGNLLRLGLPVATEVAVNGGQVSAVPQTLPQLLSRAEVGNAATGISLDGDVVRLTRADTVIPTDAGVVIASGTLDASNSNVGFGGNVDVLGERVVLLGAQVNASGADSGGQVRIGGGYGGQESIQNAEFTYIGPDSFLDVRGNGNGDGGQAIVGSDDITEFYGNIDVRGGHQIGDGGFVEVSGKVNLSFDGDVALDSTNGNNGNLLLDPGIVVIDDLGSQDSSSFGVVVPNGIGQSQGGTSQEFSISAGRIINALASGNVNISAAQRITVQEEINATSTPNNLTLEAPEIDIQSSSSISLGGGNINLFSTNSSRSIAKFIRLGSPREGFILDSNGGDITLTGPEVDLGGSINSNGGDITFNSPVFVDDDFELAPTVTSGNGSGTIRFNSTLDSQSESSSQRFTVTAGQGDVFFEEAVGSINPLETLNIQRVNEFGIGLASGNNISLKNFSGNTLRISTLGNITIDAVDDLSSQIFAQSFDGDAIIIGTQGDISLTDSVIGSGREEIQLTALSGSITLDNSTINSGSDGARLDARSIEILNDSELRSRETLNLSASSVDNILNTSSVDNILNIRDSELITQNLLISSPNGLINIENSQIQDLDGFSGPERRYQFNARAIDIRNNSTLQPLGLLSLEATESITLESSRLSTSQDLELLANNSINITDNANPLIVKADNNILIRGEESINIQSLENPQSALISGNNITLASDGTIIGQGRFLNSGDFSILTLSGGSGNLIYTPISSNGIISSGGNISFGSYTGSALKVEAGGDIRVNGDISITRSNTELQGTDSDIVILNADSALILRAGLSDFNSEGTLPGLNERRNETNILPSRILGDTDTTFSSSGAPPLGGNIIVGNIETENGPVILSALGNIRTGNISTDGDMLRGSIEDESFGGYVNLSADGNIQVETIDTSGSDGGDITINAGGTFRAVGAFLAEDFRIDGTREADSIEGAQFINIYLLTSIDATGGSQGGANIDIQHSARTLTVGPVFQSDSNGEFIFRQVFREEDSMNLLEDENGNVILGAPVFPVDDNGSLVYRTDRTEADTEVSPVLAITMPFSSTEASFTAGAITVNQDNEGKTNSVRDNVSVGAGTIAIGNINLSSNYEPDDNPGGGGTDGGGDSSDTTAELPNITDFETRPEEGAITQETCSLTNSSNTDDEFSSNTDDEFNERSQDSATRTIDKPCVRTTPENLLTIPINDVSSDNICNATEIVTRENGAEMISSSCQIEHRDSPPSIFESL